MKDKVFAISIAAVDRTALNHKCQIVVGARENADAYAKTLAETMDKSGENHSIVIVEIPGNLTIFGE